MEVRYSEFRQNLKKYLDLVCDGGEFVNVRRLHGCDAIVISEDFFKSITYDEFKELQTASRLTSYVEKLTDIKIKEE